MKFLKLFISVLLLSGCLYSFEDECFVPVMATVSFCHTDKGEMFSAIAHYQKLYSLGKTDPIQRWKDAVNCGAEYGDSKLDKLKSSNYEFFLSCMESKGYKRYWPAECGYKNPKWDKGVCNE